MKHILSMRIRWLCYFGLNINLKHGYEALYVASFFISGNCSTARYRAHRSEFLSFVQDIPHKVCQTSGCYCMSFFA